MSKVKNWLARTRGKTRNHKHLYDIISKSRYNAMMPEHKVKYRFFEEDGKYHLLPSQLWPHVIAGEHSVRQKKLNNNARAARLLKMQGPPNAPSLIRSKTKRLPTSSKMTPTGSPLSPSTPQRTTTRKNTPKNKTNTVPFKLNAYNDDVQIKIREYLRTQHKTLDDTLTKLHSYNADFQDMILLYIRQGNTLKEAFDLADDLN